MQTDTLKHLLSFRELSEIQSHWASYHSHRAELHPEISSFHWPPNKSLPMNICFPGECCQKLNVLTKYRHQQISNIWSKKVCQIKCRNRLALITHRWCQPDSGDVCVCVSRDSNWYFVAWWWNHLLRLVDSKWSVGEDVSFSLKIASLKILICRGKLNVYSILHRFLRSHLQHTTCCSIISDIELDYETNLPRAKWKQFNKVS